jgi:hypothetical protein
MPRKTQLRESRKKNGEAETYADTFAVVFPEIDLSIGTAEGRGLIQIYEVSKSDSFDYAKT